MHADVKLTSGASRTMPSRVFGRLLVGCQRVYCQSKGLVGRGRETAGEGKKESGETKTVEKKEGYEGRGVKGKD